MTTTDRKPRALLLAGDREALSSLDAALRRRGFDVVAGSDGGAGVELLLEHLLSLDVLVADLDLPGRCGASLLELVRVAGGERDLAVVLRCGDLSPHAGERLRALGADALVRATDAPEAVAAVADEAIWARQPYAVAAAA
jgi:CheY-like chemotaxis protein